MQTCLFVCLRQFYNRILQAANTKTRDGGRVYIWMPGFVLVWLVYKLLIKYTNETCVKYRRTDGFRWNSMPSM